MEVLIQKKNVILDATIASTLMSCARLTDFRFNHNFMSLHGKSSSLEMGLIVHIILDTFNKGMIGGKSRGQAISTAIAAGEEFATAEVKNVSPDDINLVFDTMQQYFDYWKNDFWIPLESEVVKSAVIYEDDEIRIMWKAKIDLIVDTNQGIFSEDHKTMKQRRDTVSLNNQFMGQCVILGTKKVIINKIGFQTSLKPHEKFTRPTVDYNAERLFEWQNDIIPYYAKFMLYYAESGYWPPNFTHCENKYGLCAFKEVCEAPPNLREDEIRRLFVVGPAWDPVNEKE
jgi:hypothetical protein